MPGGDEPHHLVVPQVDNQEIPILVCAVAGDGQDDVRVDRRHGRVDDLELGAGVLLLQHRLKHSPETKRRLGRPHGGRASQYEDAVGVLCPGGWQLPRRGHSGDGRGEKPPAELLIRRVGLAPLGLDEETSRVTVSQSPQADFQHQKEDVIGRDSSLTRHSATTYRDTNRPVKLLPKRNRRSVSAG